MNFGSAVLISLLCMAVVFIILVVLMLIAKLIPLCNKLPSWKERREQKEERQQERSLQSLAGQVAAAAPLEDQSELLAAISAAIAVYTEKEAGTGTLVVRSVRRVGAGVPAWNMAGRYEQLSK